MIHKGNHKKGTFSVISNLHLKDKRLSLKSKALLTQMLTLPPTWDYNLRGLATINKEGVDAIRTAVRELEACGYVVRRQVRDDKGHITDTVYDIYETPYLDEPRADNPIMAMPDTDPQTLFNINNTNNTNNTNIDVSINQSINRACMDETDMVDAMDAAMKYEALLKNNIGYVELSAEYGKERLDNIVGILLDVLLTSGSYVRISGNDRPAELVKSQILKLSSLHIEYVLGCMDNITEPIHNIKAYMLTALYNAPATMESYYRAQTMQHILY